MIEIESKKLIFKTKTIWFSDNPFEVQNCSHVTFRECKNNIKLNNFNKQEFTTLTIDLTQDLDLIWRNMNKSSCRYSINKAKKDGISIEINVHYKEFYDINKKFRKNKGIDTNSIDIEFLTKYGTLFVAKHEGEIIGGQFYVEDKENIRWLIGASKRLEVNKEKATLIGNANRAILWEAIIYSKNKGIKLFDFGGYYTGKNPDIQKEKINKFKKSFGGKLTTYYDYQKDYSKLYTLLKVFAKQYDYFKAIVPKFRPDCEMLFDEK